MLDCWIFADLLILYKDSEIAATYRNAVFIKKRRGFETVKHPRVYSEPCQTTKMEIFKVVCVVKLKLAFMEWLFYNLVILIKLYKIRYLNFDKALLFPRNQAIWQKNWKLWRAPTTTKFNVFAEILQTFLTYQCLQKGARDFFILFRTWVINKDVKNECVETRYFLIVANKSRS